MPGIQAYLILSGLIFAIGLYGALSKRNIITVLMCVELMFTGVTIAAVAMSRFTPPAALLANPGAPASSLGTLLTGQVFALFIIAVAAAEVVVGLAIVIASYRNRESISITDLDSMRH